MSDQDVTLRIIKYNAMVFDQIFCAFQPKLEIPLLPVGDGTSCLLDDEEDGSPV